MNSRIAIIDMGTNTFHLLVATETSPPEIIFRYRSAVKIGEGGINDGIITPGGFSRAITALQGFKKMTDKLRVGKILAFATSAIRSASNGKQFVDEIRKET